MNLIDFFLTNVYLLNIISKESVKKIEIFFLIFHFVKLLYK